MHVVNYENLKKVRYKDFQISGLCTAQVEVSKSDSRRIISSNFMILREESEMPPTKRGRRGVSDADDESDDYRKKRDRNNEAVKKSRFKTKQRTQETFTRVNKLKAENQMLEEKVKTLTKDLQFLKDLFMEYASNSQNPKFEGIDIEKLLEDVQDDDKKHGGSSKS